jgi:uncharacterized protein
MSEYINNHEKRIESLFKFSQGILQGKNGKKLLEKYGEALQYITPHDIIAMEEKQLKMGISPNAIKEKIEKVMNVIYDNLKKYQWDKPEKGHPLYYFMLENREVEKVLERMKKDLLNRNLEGVRSGIESLFIMDRHYLRKENILFPFLEKTWENCRPLAVMWSIHDDIRLKLKEIQNLIEEAEEFSNEIFKFIGDLFFLMYGMIFKEELIIFPVAMETLSSMDWKKIAQQSYDIGFSYIAPVPKVNINPFIEEIKYDKEKTSSSIFQTDTGQLNQDQLNSLFNTLPLDLTFIDENDEVAYFSNPKDRFFPRSPAIVGRKVQNCHPPESVHVVEKILHSFKSGEKDEALFHINMRGKFILIRYFAVRNENSKYLGTVEISQDVTDIRSLQGDKKLLDWE